MTADSRWTTVRALALLALSVAALLAAAPVARAAPANDAFQQAISLPPTFPVSVSGNDSGAGKEGGEPAHAGDPGGSSVWYSWRAPSSGPVAISACPYTEATPDTLLAVYTGMSFGELKPVAGNDDSPLACLASGSQVEFDAVPNTTYWIAVDSKAGKQGIFSLDIEGAPSNDAFSSPQVLPPVPGLTGGSTLFAGSEPSEPVHAGGPGGHSLWFSWTPTISGPAAFTACGQSPSIDTLLAVYTGSGLAALAPVAASDDATGPTPGFCQAPGTHSEVEFDATAGTAYRIAVDTDGLPGDVSLVGERSPSNDDFAAARKLDAFLPWYAVGTTAMAGSEPGEPDHAGVAGGHSVWFSWTAGSTGPVAVSTCTADPDAADLDTLLAVYTGAAVGALTPVAGNDDSAAAGCENSDSAVEIAAVAGTTYDIAIDGKAGTSGGFQLRIEGAEANDEFASARSLGSFGLPTWGTSSNRFAGVQSGEPDHAGGPGGASVWFMWTATASGPVSVDTCESRIDTLLAVYTGAAVGALTPVAGNDDAGGGCSPRSELSFAAAAGTTYWIAIDGKAGARGKSAFTSTGSRRTTPSVPPRRSLRSRTAVSMSGRRCWRPRRRVSPGMAAWPGVTRSGTRGRRYGAASRKSTSARAASILSSPSTRGVRSGG